MSDVIGLVVLSTFPDPEIAARIARTLVEERLAACVNLVATVRSIYRWQGAINDDAESLAIIKTTADRYPALAARMSQLHPYHVPEIIALPLEDGHPPYLAWLAGQVDEDEVEPGGAAGVETMERAATLETAQMAQNAAGAETAATADNAADTETAATADNAASVVTAATAENAAEAEMAATAENATEAEMAAMPEKAEKAE